MNQEQARQFLNLKLKTRINEAKCKALTEDKLLAGLFSQEIQQMHYETIQGKLAMASTMKALSKAHNNVLFNMHRQYSKTIKSNTDLLQTINGKMNELMDKERDMIETQEETVLTIRDAIDSEFDSILDNDIQEQTDSDKNIPLSLPPVPNDPIKKLEFSNVIIKTVDEVEEEKQCLEQNQEEDIVYFVNDDSTENDYADSTNSQLI